MIIIATQDYKAFYSFKASAWHKAFRKHKASKKPYHSAAVTAT